jgi:hypothetical protein
VYGVQLRVWRAAWRITVENLMRAFDCGSSTKDLSIPLPLGGLFPAQFRLDVMSSEVETSLTIDLAVRR